MLRPSSENPSRVVSRDSALIQATIGQPSASQRAATTVESCDFPLPCIPTSTVRGAALPNTASSSASCSRLEMNPIVSMGRLPNRI